MQLVIDADGVQPSCRLNVHAVAVGSGDVPSGCGADRPVQLGQRAIQWCTVPSRLPSAHKPVIDRRHSAIQAANREWNAGAQHVASTRDDHIAGSARTGSARSENGRLTSRSPRMSLIGTHAKPSVGRPSASVTIRACGVNSYVRHAALIQGGEVNRAHPRTTRARANGYRCADRRPRRGARGPPSSSGTVTAQRRDRPLHTAPQRSNSPCIVGPICDRSARDDSEEVEDQIAHPRAWIEWMSVSDKTRTIHRATARANAHAPTLSVRD